MKYDFKKLEQGWIEHSPNDATYNSAVQYFNYRMHGVRDMDPVSRRRVRELARCLYEFRNKITTASPTDLRWYQRQVGQIRERVNLLR